MKLAEDLKKAVLQAAMQGKLTKQLKTDSSVDELLKKIAEEKAKLIAEGKIRKDTTKAGASGRALAEITEDEIPFDIPENWRYIKLGELCQTQLGKTLDKGKNKGKFVPYLCSINVGWGKFNLENIKELRLEEDEKEQYRICKGDLLICEGGDVGRSAIWEHDREMYYQNALHRVRFYSGINKYYILQLILTYKAIGLIDKVSKGMTIKHFVQGALINLPIPLPPIEEQQRIVEKLNQILPLIDEYGKEEDELIELCQKFPEEMKKSILQAAMQGKLTKQLESDSSVDELLKKIAEEKVKLIEEGKIRKDTTKAGASGRALAEITEEEIPFDIPENWRWERWGNLSNSIQYGFNASAISSGYAKMVRISDIQDNKILWDSVPYCEITEAEYEKYKLNNSDLLFARTGGTVGKSVLVSGMTERSVYAGYLIRSHYNLNLNPQYLKYFMECPLYWNQLTQGTTKGCQPNCNGQTLSQMIVPLPPIEEQQRIVEKLNTILPIIDSMAVYGTKKKAGRPKQEEALAFISSLLGTNKSTDSKPVNPEITELKAKAKEELPAIVKKYAELMDVTYNRITIRHQKTRWGSCTKTGNLSFNCLLMKMPETVRNYVIIHELAHRKELNHSTKFWAVVSEYCPWYKEAKQWLKDNGQKLMER